MKKYIQQLLLLTLLSASCLLSGCGKTGPLYLPDSPQQPTQQDK